MDWSELAQEAGRLPLIEVRRLQEVLSEMVDDPQRLFEVRRHLRPGMKVRYLDFRTNRFVPCEILELKRTNALIRLEDGAEWLIHYSCILLDGLEPAQAPATTKQSWQVGDAVGFRDRQDRLRLGRIHALNRKTAGVELDDGQRWRVSYALLVPVHETSAAATNAGVPEGKPGGVKWLN